MTTNVVRRLEEEIDETNDDLKQVTVSRKDLKELIQAYKALLEGQKKTGS